MKCCAYAHQPRRAAHFRSIHRKIQINIHSYVRRDNLRIPQNSRPSQLVSIVNIAQSSRLAKSFWLVHVRKYKPWANNDIRRRKNLQPDESIPTDRQAKMKKTIGKCTQENMKDNNMTENRLTRTQICGRLRTHISASPVNVFYNLKIDAPKKYTHKRKPQNARNANKYKYLPYVDTIIKYPS